VFQPGWEKDDFRKEDAMKERKKIAHQWKTWKKATDKAFNISSNNVERTHEKQRANTSPFGKNKYNVWGHRPVSNSVGRG
jgi:hypothetical protein